MFCPNCGTKSVENERFCANCGENLNPEQPQNPQSEISSPEYISQPDLVPEMLKPKRKRGLFITAAAAGFVLVAGLVAWLNFPSILKSFSTDAYLKFAAGKTATMISSSTKDVSKLIGADVFSKIGDILKYDVTVDGIEFSESSYWSNNSVSLPDLFAHIGMVIDSENKAVSYAADFKYDGIEGDLRLFIDETKTAFSAPFLSNKSWFVNNETFGRDMNSTTFGKFMDDSFSLDVSSLFPDKTAKKDTSPQAEAFNKATEKFMKKLVYKEDTDFNTDDFNGKCTAMTAEIDCDKLVDYILELIDIYEEYYNETLNSTLSAFNLDNVAGTSASSMFSELRKTVNKMYADEILFTQVINSKDMLVGIGLSATIDKQSVNLVAGMAGDKSLIDKLFVKLTAKDAYSKNTITITSEGNHTGVGGEFTDVTTIKSSDSSNPVKITTSVTDSKWSLKVSSGDMLLNIKGGMKITDTTATYSLTSFSYESGDYYNSSYEFSGKIEVLIGAGKSGDLNELAGSVSVSTFSNDDLREIYASLERLLHKNEDLLESVGYSFYTSAIEVFPEYYDAFYDYYWYNYDFSGLLLFN